jgi:hypothetical protein
MDMSIPSDASGVDITRRDLFEIAASRGMILKFCDLQITRLWFRIKLAGSRISSTLVNYRMPKFN